FDRNALQHFNVVRLNARLFPVEPYEADLFARYGLQVTQEETDNPDALIRLLAGCDAVFTTSTALPTRVVESLTRCRVIARLGIGTDKIDVDTATRLGIVVANVPSFCLHEQADHTMALLLALARKLPQMASAMHEGAWLRARRQALSNRRLAGKVLGLIGFGRSAQAVAVRAQAFGMQVIATRRNLATPNEAAARLGVEVVDLGTLLSRSDYVSLHLPLNADTRHLIDGIALAKMKPTACLVNVARGAIVDEDALIAALRAGRLAGAGLDTYEHINVFSERQQPPDSPLLTLDNVVLTPHVAAESVESSQEAHRIGIENVVSLLSGHWPNPENVVNPNVQPRFPLAAYDETLFG
ncbi:MAG: C-terminal binding protein, partial [Anaerolineae bacterium]